MSPVKFLINIATFMVILIGLCIWASRSTSRASAFWLMLWASGNLLWDFFAHLSFTVMFNADSAGLTEGCWAACSDRCAAVV
jgi:hypothetical protein